MLKIKICKFQEVISDKNRKMFGIKDNNNLDLKQFHK